LPGGFIATRSGWCWEYGPNYGVVDLQVDKYQEPEALRFTVNIGVYSALLASFFDGVDFTAESRPPADTNNCVLRTRLECLMPENQKRWWTISDLDLNEVAREIAELIAHYALPYINSNADDRSLYQVWSALLRAFPRDLGYQQLRFLAVLACSLGAREVMEEALAALEEQWADKDMVLDLGSFVENLSRHGLKVKPVLSKSALLLRQQLDPLKGKKTRNLSR